MYREGLLAYSEGNFVQYIGMLLQFAKWIILVSEIDFKTVNMIIQDKKDIFW